MHVKGEWAGQPFRPLGWQRDAILRPLFGTLDAHGYRRYRTAFIEIPRKNGKSTLAAGIALYLLFADGEVGAEIYSAAADRDQAAIVFETAKQMVLASPALRRHAEITRNAIVVPKLGATYKVLSADADTAHGVNAHGIIFDELHAQPNRHLWDALTTSTGARRQPLVVAITTAGYDRTSICWEQHEYARRVLAGIIDDPTYFAFIATADEGDDWQSPATWRKANPSLGITVKEDYLAAQARRAAETPAYQNTFRRLHLNQWTQQATRWIDLATWDANAGAPIDPEALRGRRCYGGLDLSATQDLTAWVLIFPHPDDEDTVDVVARFWCPESRLTDTRNPWRELYQVWARDGWLVATPGPAVDLRFVREQVLADAQRYDIVRIGYDAWYAAQLVVEFQAAGLDGRIAAVPKGYKGLSGPARELERRLLTGKIHHGGNPILRWMADNVAVRQDPDGNLRPDKASSQGKIDGIVALLLALSPAMLTPDDSVYDVQGLKTL